MSESPSPPTSVAQSQASSLTVAVERRSRESTPDSDTSDTAFSASGSSASRPSSRAHSLSSSVLSSLSLSSRDSQGGSSVNGEDFDHIQRSQGLGSSWTDIGESDDESASSADGFGEDEDTPQTSQLYAETVRNSQLYIPDTRNFNPLTEPPITLHTEPAPSPSPPTTFVSEPDAAKAPSNPSTTSPIPVEPGRNAFIGEPKSKSPDSIITNLSPPNYSLQPVLASDAALAPFDLLTSTISGKTNMANTVEVGVATDPSICPRPSSRSVRSATPASSRVHSRAPSRASSRNRSLAPDRIQPRKHSQYRFSAEVVNWARQGCFAALFVALAAWLAHYAMNLPTGIPSEVDLASTRASRAASVTIIGPITSFATVVAKSSLAPVSVSTIDPSSCSHGGCDVAMHQKAAKVVQDWHTTPSHETVELTASGPTVQVSHWMSPPIHDRRMHPSKEWVNSEQSAETSEPQICADHASRGAQEALSVPGDSFDAILAELAEIYERYAGPFLQLLAEGLGWAITEGTRFFSGESSASKRCATPPGDVPECFINSPGSNSSFARQISAIRHGARQRVEYLRDTGYTYTKWKAREVTKVPHNVRKLLSRPRAAAAKFCRMALPPNRYPNVCDPRHYLLGSLPTAQNPCCCGICGRVRLPPTPFSGRESKES